MSLQWKTWSQRVFFRWWEGKSRLRKNRSRSWQRGPVSERPRVESLERRDLLSGTWTLLTHAPSTNIGPMILLSDGNVMAQQAGTTSQWYKLTPDNTGNYINGTWSSLSSMSTTRQYYAANVLPSGNVVVEGGEYSSAGGDTNRGEIYNSVTNHWSAIANFPQSNFGDDPTQMLDPTPMFPNGRILAGYISGQQTYFYNPTTNAWSFAANKYRSEGSDEETWTKLPDGSILSYDIFASLAQHSSTVRVHFRE